MQSALPQTVLDRLSAFLLSLEKIAGYAPALFRLLKNGRSLRIEKLAWPELIEELHVAEEDNVNF